MEECETMVMAWYYAAPVLILLWSAAIGFVAIVIGLIKSMSLGEW